MTRMGRFRFERQFRDRIEGVDGAPECGSGTRPYHSTPVFAAKAEGAVIEDVDGNRYIDFAAGLAA